MSNEEVFKKASLPSIESTVCFGCSCAGMTMSQGSKTHACSKQSSSAGSKEESVIVVLQESVTKINLRDSLHGRESAISRGSRRPQTQTAVVKFEAKRHEAAKERRGRQKERAAPQLPSAQTLPVQSAVGCAHQETDSTAINELTRTGHQPSPKSSSARNQPSLPRSQ